MTTIIKTVKGNIGGSTADTRREPLPSRPMDAGPWCLLLLDVPEAGGFAFGLQESLEQLEEWHSWSSPFVPRLVLVLSNPPGPNEATLAGASLTRLAELAGNGTIELIAVTIGGASSKLRDLPGATRTIKLEDTHTLGTLLAELAAVYPKDFRDGQPPLPAMGWTDVETDAPVSAPSTTPPRIELSCGAVGVQVAVGTDVDYVARLAQRLTQSPAVIAPPALLPSPFELTKGSSPRT